MIYVTGDTHTPSSFSKFNFQESKNLTKDDYLIVVGDFELLWFGPKADEWIQKVNELPYTTLILDGNYDDLPKLKSLPVADKFGGKVGVLSDSIFWLKRGEIYEIEGHTFLTIGGATSINKEQRTEGVDWWSDEELSEDDKEHILQKTEEYPDGVDFIISHTCPTSILGAIKEYAMKDSVSEFLEEIFYTVGFNRWYFGHMHCDAVSHENFFAVYDEVLKVERGEKEEHLEPVLLLE